jgi:hypothetical protein
MPFGKPWRITENNTKRNFKDIGLDGVDWIPLTQENDRWQAFMCTVKKKRNLQVL